MIRYNRKVVRPNQVWATDITDIRLQTGFVCLVAIMDWLDGAFCAETLEEALTRGRPEIFNSDQGSQCTSQACTGRLQQAAVRISMDGKGPSL